jgi:glutamate racemase
VYTLPFNKVAILDSASIVAKALKIYLEEEHLLADARSEKDRFLVSDITKSFESAAKMFFQDLIKLEKHPIWD